MMQVPEIMQAQSLNSWILIIEIDRGLPRVSYKKSSGSSDVLSLCISLSDHASNRSRINYSMDPSKH